MTDVEVINLSLSHIGHTNSISDLDEDSEEARIAGRWFVVAHKELLEMRPWRFARKIANLSLVEEDPNVKWQYAYRYPSDCLTAIEIPFYSAGNSALYADPDGRNPLPILAENKVNFDLGVDDSGSLLFTNVESAQLEYTKYVNIDLCPNYYCIALSFLLASYIHEPLSKGDMTGLAQKLQAKFEEKLAQAESKNEKQVVQYRTNESAFTLARR
jgi:hypothetical protein